MTQEKICFRYDGSEEAKQCIKWINKGKPINRHCCGFNNKFYAPDGSNSVTTEDITTTHRLVTPAEFLRIAKGETEWTPKYGEEVEVSDDLAKWHKRTYIGKNPFKSTYPYITVMDDASIIAYTRPVRKSLREELTDIIQDHSMVDLILTRFNVTPKVND